MAFPYNPKKVTGSWRSILFIGPWNDEFYMVTKNADATTEHVGGHGHVSVAINADETALATVKLVQGSAANALLSAQVPNAERNSLPTGPFLIKDLNGADAVFSEVAWIKKVTDIKWGNEVVAREWVFFLEKAIITAGGVL
jgi:hypothetical protein